MLNSSLIVSSTSLVASIVALTPLAPLVSLEGRLSPEEAWPAGDPSLRARTVDLPSGVRVRVVEGGPADGKVAVLVHGWACSAFSWRHVARRLMTEGYRVLIPDLKGHGFSDKPPMAEEYSGASMTEHLLEVLDACGVERAALLAGHSMGGAICAAAAVEQPARFERLALLAPVGFGRVSALKLGRWASPQVTVGVLPYMVPRWLVGSVLKMTYGGPAVIHEDDVAEYWAPSQFPGYAAALRHLLHEFDWLPHDGERLRRLRQPVLVMFGSRDRVVVPLRCEELVRELPHGELRMVRKAGHHLPEEAVEQVNDALLALLREPVSTGTATVAP